MTLREKFEDGFKDSKENAKYCEQIADYYAIEILESYHNSLFIIPLKKGEAKRIVEHLKKEKGL